MITGFEPQDLDQERIGRLASEFKETEYGKYLLYQLTTMRNTYHDLAENERTIAAKALAVDKASAINEVIKRIESDAEQFTGGYWDNEREQQEEFTS